MTINPRAQHFVNEKIHCAFDLLTEQVLENEPTILFSYNKKYKTTCDPSTDVCKGIYAPAQGDVRTLLIYIRFADDTDQSISYWTKYPNSNDIYDVESFMANSINSSVSTISDNYFNVSNYFNTMSDGNFNMIGEVVYVEAPALSTYDPSLTTQQLQREVNIDILEALDTNPNINLSDYDNWKTLGANWHEKSPDGILDNVYMIYRNPQSSYIFTQGGIANLNGVNGFASDMITLSSGLKIQMGIDETNGGVSGVSIHLGKGNFDRKTKFDDSFIHEYAHHIFGGGHPYGHGYWGIFGGNSGTNSVNAYEKELLDWLDTTQVKEIQMGIPYTLNDFTEYNEALRYTIDANSDEYYYFENHQRIHSTTGISNTYDIPNNNIADKGIFVLHVKGVVNRPNSLRSVVSDGNWNWVVDSWSNACGSNYGDNPAWEKGEPNQYGDSFKGRFTSVNNPQGKYLYKPNLYIKSDSVSDCPRYFLGDDPTDFSGFNGSRKAYISSITNPRFLTHNDNDVDLMMKIISDSSGQIKLIFEEDHNPYSITENTTWDGQIFLENTLTVQSGAKLTIKPNTIVYVEDAKAINIYGELDADGVDFIPMNSNWNGITFHNGSNGEIANSTITGVHSYGGAAIKVYSNNHIEIRGNTIANITGAASGILFSNASNNYAYENHIENTSSYGIYAYNSSVNAFNNFIKGHSSAGVYSTGYSNILFSAVTSPYYNGENTIVGGKYGLQIGSASTLHSGNSSSFASQNRIANQIGSGWAHIYSTSYYTNYAQYNYFKPYNGSGGSAPVVGGWGPVNSTPYLTTDPDPGVGFKRITDQDQPLIFNSLDEEKLFKALEHKLQSDLIGASNLLEELVRQSKSAYVVEQSLHELAWIIIDSENKDLVNRFFNLEIDLLGTGFEFDYKVEKARVHYGNANPGLALDVLESMLERDKEVDLEKVKNATILAAHIAADVGDNDLALKFMEKAATFKTKSMDEFMLLELQNYINSKDGVANDFSDETTQLETPTVIELSNYPNPFNPSTTIRFELPTDSHVELVVFDMLGRKVAELVNEFRTQGTHITSFDATNLSSGIYLYQFKANDQIITNQMTLIK